MVSKQTQHYFNSVKSLTYHTQTLPVGYIPPATQHFPTFALQGRRVCESCLKMKFNNHLIDSKFDKSEPAGS